MKLITGLELNNEGRNLAWALDYPGCFSYGDDDQEALLRLPQAFVAYQYWVNFKAGEKSWLKDITDFDVRLVETFKVYAINEKYEVVEQGYDVNAWFQNDWVALTEEEVQQGLLLMDWSRQDLLQLLEGIPTDLREKKSEGERWNILGIVNHISNAEWWYMDRLGLTDLKRTELPKDTFTRIELVREQLKNVMPELIGKNLIHGKEGEFWSPRKLLRRVLWHEKDHIHHIYKLIS
ncbi:MAG TPA: DinB family protein [Anaerolineaceae bacterium]|nr:DinB family protein [Anaerolineaceae bacterium]